MRDRKLIPQAPRAGSVPAPVQYPVRLLDRAARSGLFAPFAIDPSAIRDTMTTHDPWVAQAWFGTP